MARRDRGRDRRAPVTVSVTITLADDLVDAFHQAVDTLDVELDGWYPSALDTLVQTLIAADPRSIVMPREPAA